MPKYEGVHGKRSSKGWTRFRIVYFSFFLVLFLLSSFMIFKNVSENQKAKNEYYELQAIARQERNENTAEAADKEEISSADNKSGLNAGEKPATDSEGKTVPEKQQQITAMDFSKFKEINPDIIGWIHAEGTIIDYPVAQTDNNEYYLNHLYNKTRNSSGTIFADYRNAADFSDRNTVIYGHHMKNGTMFRALENYKDQKFYDDNPTMTLYTPNGDYTIELISGTVEDGTHQFVRFDFDSEEAFVKYVEGFRSRSTFVSEVEIMPGDRIVSLCTCSYESTNARFMVIGRLVSVTKAV